MPSVVMARLIINPSSGRGQGYRHARSIRRCLSRSGVKFRASFSRSPGDIERQVAKACAAGSRYVVVAGGDGTVHEAVNGLLATANKVVLGVVPLGTGNDFAKAIGMAKNWRSACNSICNCIAVGKTRKIDAGRCNDFFFANGVGIGLDARVTIVSKSFKWLPGSLAYIVALLIVVTKGLSTTRARIHYDGELCENDISMIVACNGPWLGGLFHIAPRAHINDGKLQVVVAAPLSRLRLLALAPRVMRGTHQGTSAARFVDCRTLRLELDQAFPVESDGEVKYQRSKILDIEVLPGVLQILV